MGRALPRFGWLLLAVIVFFGFFATSAVAPHPRPAFADSYTVNEPDNGLSDDVCDAVCTLSDAIVEANNHPNNLNPASAPDEITIPDLGEDIVLTAQLPPITEDVVITGPGAANQTIDANATPSCCSNLRRIFTINDNVEATISGLTLTGGAEEYGGAVYIGAGGTAHLNSVVITANSAIEIEGGGEGGGVYVGAFGLLDLTNTTISNNTADYAGGGVYLDEDADLTMNGGSLTLNLAHYGGGLYTYGATEGSSTVDITAANIDQNVAIETGGGMYISSDTQVTLNPGTVISNNTAGDEGNPDEYIFGTSGYGGGIYVEFASITGSQVTIANNQALWASEGISEGGGIYMLTAEVSLTDSTIGGSGAGNSAGQGGGVYANSGSGTLTLTRSTVIGNHADSTGGGLYLDQDVANITNSTITGNTATSDGAALYLHGSPSLSATANLTHTTVAYNVAGGGTSGAAITADANSQVSLTNTLLAANQADTCSLQAGTLTLTGANLSDTACSDGTSSVPTDASAADLDPAALNGGLTLNHALQSTNAAVNGVDNVAGQTACLALGDPPTDQRGIERPQATNCDIGSFELEQAQADLTVVKTHSPDTVGIGGGFSWTIEIRNEGGTDANFDISDSVFVDELPAGATYYPEYVFVSPIDSGYTGIECSIVENLLECVGTEPEGGVIPAGGGFSILIFATADVQGELANPGDGICMVDPPQPETGVVDESNENNNTCSDTVSVESPDLVVTKSTSADDSPDEAPNVVLGDSFWWYFDITNDGNVPAYISGDDGQTVTVLHDDLPQNFSYNSSSIEVSAPDGGLGVENVSCNLDGFVLTCETDGVGVNNELCDSECSPSRIRVAILATAEQIGTWTNPGDGGSCEVDPDNVVIESDDANNGCSDTVNVVAADLAAVKTNSTEGGTLTIGESFLWTITISNEGDASATFYENEPFLLDDLPSGATYGTPEVAIVSGVSGAESIDCSIDSGTLECGAVGVESSVTIDAGGSLTVSFSVTPTETGQLTNPAIEGTCAVNPALFTSESVDSEANEANNLCSDTVTVNPVATATPSVTVTTTPSATVVPTSTPTPTNTPPITSPIEGATETPTATGSPTSTPTFTPSPTGTLTPTPTVSVTSSPTPVPGATFTATPVFSAIGVTQTPGANVSGTSTTPEATVSGTAIPGTTPPIAANGTATTTTTPTPSPTPTAASTPVSEVAGIGAQRSEWVRSVRGLSETSSDINFLLTNLILTGVMLLLIFLTSEIFNQTIRDNQDDIEGWIRDKFAPIVGVWEALQSTLHAATANSQHLLNFFWLATVLVVSVFIEGFLNPGFPFSHGSILLFLSLFVSVGIMTYLTEGAEAFMARSIWHENAAVRVFPLAIVIAGICVFFSRLGGIAPGVLYGFVGTAVFLTPPQMTDDQNGKNVYFPQIFLLTLCVISWLLVDQFRGTNPSHFDVFMEGVLVGIFVGGLEGIFINMIPIAYLDGHKIMKWSRLAWFAMAAVATYLFWLVLLNDQRAYFDAIQQTTPAIALIVCGLCFGLTCLTWLWFRYRPGAHD